MIFLVNLDDFFVVIYTGFHEDCGFHQICSQFKNKQIYHYPAQSVFLSPLAAGHETLSTGPCRTPARGRGRGWAFRIQVGPEIRMG